MSTKNQKPTLSLEQKISQLLILGFHGKSLEDARVQTMLDYTRQGLLSGLAIYRYNIESPEQLKPILKEFKNASQDIPLFISLDQEGGKVQRLNSSNGFEDTLSAKKVAETMSVQEAYEHYEKLGAMLKDAGFNFDCAPCVDIDGLASEGIPSCKVIGGIERAYSSDPEVVAKYAAAMVDALESKGILTCLKHFPGHGRASDDSHSGLVDITNAWTEEELKPYELLIKRGKASAVMSAHLINQNVDSELPATLSSKWLSKLRRDFNFKGLIVSDCLHMGAILKHYTLEDIVVHGLNAGIDLFYFSNNPLACQEAGIRHSSDSKGDYVRVKDWCVPDIDLPKKFIATVKKALESGSVSVEQVETACQRVLKAKEQLE